MSEASTTIQPLRYEDLSEAEKAAHAQRWQEYLNGRPDGVERPDDVACIFDPSCIAFRDGKYVTAVYGEIDAWWSIIKPRISSLLEFMPCRWRLDYIRERLELGGMIGLLFADANGARGAGLIEPIEYDGESILLAMVYSLSPLDLTDVAHALEINALHFGADRVSIYLVGDQDTPVLDGYTLNWRRGVRLMQSAAVRPIQ